MSSRRRHSCAGVSDRGGRENAWLGLPEHEQANRGSAVGFFLTQTDSSVQVLCWEEMGKDWMERAGRGGGGRWRGSSRVG